VWDYEVEGHLEWNHPAIGPDGGLYVGSSVGGVTDIFPHAPSVVPPNSSPYFYGIKGPNTPVESVSAVEEFGSVSVSPNPVDDVARITVQSGLPRYLTVSIHDLLGRETQPERSIRVYEGTQQLTIKTGILRPGVYALTLSSRGHRMSRLILKR
jgi:hypothetical protein